MVVGIVRTFFMIYGFVKSKSGKVLERFERMIVEVGEPAPAPPEPAPAPAPTPGAVPGAAPPPTEAALAAGDAATVAGGVEAAEATDTDLADVQRAHELLDLQADTERAHELLDLLNGDDAATADGGGLFGMLRRRRQPGAAQAAGE